MEKKGYLDMSFSWIFALLVGGMILFGAIYGVVKFSNIAETKGSATSATEFGNILDSLSASVESASSTKITFPTQTKISNVCEDFTNLGTQGIEIERFTKGEWTKSNFQVKWENKYIFSKEEIEGKVFQAFTKPFYFPFKIADLIYITPLEENYCFVDPPNSVRLEIKEISQENFYVSQCPKNSTRICFSKKEDCDVIVDYKTGTVSKDKEYSYFSGDELMYAAIFSDNKTYECELKRLIDRMEILTELYLEKGEFISETCSSNILNELNYFLKTIKEYDSSEDIKELYSQMYSMDTKQKYSRCELW